MAMRGLKILGTKVLYFTMLYELNKNECFFHLSLGVAEILSVGLSDQYNSLLWKNFFISLIVEELFL